MRRSARLCHFVQQLTGGTDTTHPGEKTVLQGRASLGLLQPHEAVGRRATALLGAGELTLREARRATVSRGPGQRGKPGVNLHPQDVDGVLDGKGIVPQTSASLE
ncbi:hypothetical protein GWK47_035730 [Chionoecetes opilio]|uniref:Uncharacterized protein n=1 Tax=Chionoecetes opilio TaxID=41210 RepID=A0A8J4YHV5_CHIOP|nr:hypothetical protein GWK47_035730 [Chionoecetes opilio]